MSLSSSSSTSLAPLLLAATLTAGCGETFADAKQHNEMASGETGGVVTMDDADAGEDEDRPPGFYTSTHGTGADGSSDALPSAGTSAGTSAGEPTTDAGDADDDAPPEVFQPEVQGSNAPDPITAAGPVTLSVFALDDNAIVRVDFFVNDTLAATVTDDHYGHYTHTLEIDHQDDAGDFEFRAVAVDSAGQSTSSGAIAWTVELPESGSSLFYAPNEPHPGEHIFWEDVAVGPNGEFFVVGFRVEDGVTTLLAERRGPGGSLIDDSWIAPTKDRFGVAVTFMGSTPVVVARDIDGSSWIARRLVNGAPLYQHIQDDVEWRDVAATDELVYVVGNTGMLANVGTASARTWAMTPQLNPYWVRTENAGGDKNVARAVTVADGRVFAVGQVSYENDQSEYGAAWAYATDDGAPLWSREFPTETENIHDVAVLPDGLRTAGSWDVDDGQRMLVRHLEVDDGSGVPINALEQTMAVEIAYAIAASSHGEYVVAGAGCTLGECFAQRRRYAGNSKQWQADVDGLKSPITRYVAAEALPYGYVALLGQHEVNYGNGDQGSSWLSVLHP